MPDGCGLVFSKSYMHASSDALNAPEDHHAALQSHRWAGLLMGGDRLSQLLARTNSSNIAVPHVQGPVLYQLL